MKTIKLLEKNKGKHFCDLLVGNGLSDVKPKASPAKGKIDNLCFENCSESKDWKYCYFQA